MVRGLGFGLRVAALAVLPACVVPVAPKWSDPPPNAPPRIDSAMPPVGTVLGGSTDGGMPEVTVYLADDNTQDTLYLRWIVDYPPYSAGTVLALENAKPGGGSAVRTPESFTPDCAADHLSRTSPNHRLLLAVSDRKFADDDPQSPDAVPAGNYRVEAVWPFVLNCQ